MKRFKSILCASLLTLALSPAALAGNITTRSGNITTMVSDTSRSGNITTMFLTDATSILLTAIIG
jgi:hypothetical protein